jgi:hypothetical protein
MFSGLNDPARQPSPDARSEVGQHHVVAPGEREHQLRPQRPLDADAQFSLVQHTYARSTPGKIDVEARKTTEPYALIAKPRTPPPHSAQEQRRLPPNTETRREATEVSIIPAR